MVQSFCAGGPETEKRSRTDVSTFGLSQHAEAPNLFLEQKNRLTHLEAWMNRTINKTRGCKNYKKDSAGRTESQKERKCKVASTRDKQTTMTRKHTKKELVVHFDSFLCVWRSGNHNFNKLFW